MRIGTLAAVGLAALGSVTACSHQLNESDVNSAIDSNISSIRSSIAAAPTTQSYPVPTVIIENSTMTANNARHTTAWDEFQAAPCSNVGLVNKDSVPHRVHDTSNAGVNVTVPPNSSTSFQVPNFPFYIQLDDIPRAELSVNISVFNLANCHN